MTDRLTFTLNATPVEVDAAPGESLLTVLRERLGVMSVKDGCAPQGQCGCCTVLVDGDARVACVTPADRVHRREVVTVEGLSDDERERLATAFCASGGSQCGFCTPGIVVRAASLARKGRTDRGAVDRALAAHLCRCTGWLTIYDAVNGDVPAAPRDLAAAARRATLEGGTAQAVSGDVPLGGSGFADDTAPRDALVAVPRPPGAAVEVVRAAGVEWVVGDSLADARARAGKVQGRNVPAALAPPLPIPPVPDGGVALATSWVEPAYLEPDASWCAPGGMPASPLANGGAFGGKEDSVAPGAARELADHFGRTVRVVLAREDVVRLGPKRPPVSASAVLVDRVVQIAGSVVRPGAAFATDHPWPYSIDVALAVGQVDVLGPPVSDRIRASGWAEQVLLVEGALTAAGVDRHELVDADGEAVLLDTCVRAPGGSRAGARAHVDGGVISGVDVRVAAGDPLDNVVLRSYCIGAAHMALGWVLSEGIAVDPDSGEALDLTIRSFGILRARETPPIAVEIVGIDGPPQPRAGDAVFAAVAAATWNALDRPSVLPARGWR